MNETWQQVPGHPDYYVSTEGRVLSAKRRKPVILKPLPDRRGGYLTVGLWDDKRYTRAIHRLVAEVFLGPKPEGMTVRHLDGDHLNNHVSNLAYGTVSENIRDQVRHGTHLNARKTHCWNGHPFDEANTYCPAPGGVRSCRACGRQRVAAYKIRKQMRAAGIAA